MAISSATTKRYMDRDTGILYIIWRRRLHHHPPAFKHTDVCRKIRWGYFFQISSIVTIRIDKGGTVAVEDGSGVDTDEKGRGARVSRKISDLKSDNGKYSSPPKRPLN